MSAKRKTWHDDRKCYCGARPKLRWQADVAYCGSAACWDEFMASLGYVPSAEMLAKRAEKEPPR